MYFHAEDIGLELHQQFIHGHATIHAQLGNLHAGVRHHSVGNIARLVRGGFEHGASQVLAVSKAGQAHDDAAGIRAPVRSEESGEGRHDINAAVILNFAREVFDGRSVGDDLQVIAQPLHQGTAHGYRTLEGIHGALALALEADGGQQAVLGELRGGTRI